MTSLLTVQEFEARCHPNSLPLLDDGQTLNEERIAVALEDATGIIVARLPWLLYDGDLAEEIPAQFAQALRALCADIALYRMTDTVSSSEDANLKYEETMKLLDKIDKEYQGGLSGPGFQASEIVDPYSDDDIAEMRFFKKGRMF